MKDLGPLTYFLGLEISRTKAGICINQKKYVVDLLSLAHLTDLKIFDTPLESNAKIRRDEGSPLPNPTKYRRLVGSLIYLTVMHLDICHAIQIVSRYVCKLHKSHLSVVHRILQYIRGTLDHGLFYCSTSSLHRRAYANADRAGCPDSRQSTTGWCMFLGQSLISWKCKKKNTFSKSFAKAKNKSMSFAGNEVIWLRRLLHKLGVYLPRPTSQQSCFSRTYQAH